MTYEKDRRTVQFKVLQTLKLGGLLMSCMSFYTRLSYFPKMSYSD
jgi:hypothetical protein